MNQPRFIKITRWEEFQHYKDRDPAWIKNYTRLLHDDAYLGLTGTQRAVLHGLWLVYAKSARNVLESTALLSRKLSLRVTKETLNALRDAGFIEFSASAPLAERKHDAIPEKEKRRIDTPPTPPHRGGNGSLSREDLRRYTGCRYVYTGRSEAYIRDPLGTDRPPASWPHPRPTKTEIEQALQGAAA